MAAKSRTALFYQSHPKSRRKHVRDQAEINKRPEEVAKRVALIKFNRTHKKPGPGYDASHKYDKIVGYMKASKNRGDKDNSAGDKKSRNAKYRPGGKKR
jgi:hypothetical protein